MHKDKAIFRDAGMLDEKTGELKPPKFSVVPDKLREFRFRVDIPKDEAKAYLTAYDSLKCVISVDAYSIEDAYYIVDAIFLSSPFDVHPIPFR